MNPTSAILPNGGSSFTVKAKERQNGNFPAGCDFTADLHSMGQYVQDGMRILFETA